MVRVKVCGITNLEDALSAAAAGVDALGFVFYRPSPRYIPPQEARLICQKLPPFVFCVGVFVDAEFEFVRETVAECRLDAVQFHGEESPEYCRKAAEYTKVIKAFRIREAADLVQLSDYGMVRAFLLDAFVPGKPGGTGQSFDWRLARQAKTYGPIILAGGIRPENVREAILAAEPYAVDVSSGVELSPGKKDLVKLRELVFRVRRCALE